MSVTCDLEPSSDASESTEEVCKSLAAETRSLAKQMEALRAEHMAQIRGMEALRAEHMALKAEVARNSDILSKLPDLVAAAKNEDAPSCKLAHAPDMQVCDGAQGCDPYKQVRPCVETPQDLSAVDDMSIKEPVPAREQWASNAHPKLRQEELAAREEILSKGPSPRRERWATRRASSADSYQAPAGTSSMSICGTPRASELKQDFSKSPWGTTPLDFHAESDEDEAFPKASNSHTYGGARNTSSHHTPRSNRSDDDLYKLMLPFLDPNVKLSLAQERYILRAVAGLLKNSSFEWSGPGSPLKSAIDSGRVDLVNMMLQAGACPNEHDSRGVAPLHSAVFTGRADICFALLEGGALVDARDRHGQTPLFFAPAPEICTLLCKFNADIGAVNLNGQSALHFAARAGLCDVLEWLIDHCSTSVVNLRDTYGATAANYLALSVPPATMQRGFKSSRGASSFSPRSGRHGTPERRCKSLTPMSSGFGSPSAGSPMMRHSQSPRMHTRSRSPTFQSLWTNRSPTSQSRWTRADVEASGAMSPCSTIECGSRSPQRCMDMNGLISPYRSLSRRRETTPALDTLVEEDAEDNESWSDRTPPRYASERCGSQKSNMKQRPWECLDAPFDSDPSLSTRHKQIPRRSASRDKSPSSKSFRRRTSSSRRRKQMHLPDDNSMTQKSWVSSQDSERGHVPSQCFANPDARCSPVKGRVSRQQRGRSQTQARPDARTSSMKGPAPHQQRAGPPSASLCGGGASAIASCTYRRPSQTSASSVPKPGAVPAGRRSSGGISSASCTSTTAGEQRLAPKKAGEPSARPIVVVPKGPEGKALRGGGGGRRESMEVDAASLSENAIGGSSVPSDPEQSETSESTRPQRFSLTRTDTPEHLITVEYEGLDTFSGGAADIADTADTAEIAAPAVRPAEGELSADSSDLPQGSALKLNLEEAW